MLQVEVHAYKLMEHSVSLGTVQLLDAQSIEFTARLRVGAVGVHVSKNLNLFYGPFGKKHLYCSIRIDARLARNRVSPSSVKLVRRYLTLHISVCGTVWPINSERKRMTSTCHIFIRGTKSHLLSSTGWEAKTRILRRLLFPHQGL